MCYLACPSSGGSSPFSTSSLLTCSSSSFFLCSSRSLRAISSFCLRIFSSSDTCSAFSNSFCTPLLKIHALKRKAKYVYTEKRAMTTIIPTNSPLLRSYTFISRPVLQRLSFLSRTPPACLSVIGSARAVREAEPKLQRLLLHLHRLSIV